MSKYSEKRVVLRDRLFPDEISYEPPQAGFIKMPRTLPLILGLLGSKAISGDADPTRVYLELLGRCMDSGFVELGSEAEHAYAAGYTTDRGARSWRERMEILEKAGFIKTSGLPAQKHKYVILIDLDLVIEGLQKARKIPTEWMNLYEARKLEVGYVPKSREPKQEGRQARFRRGAVLPSG